MQSVSGDYHYVEVLGEAWSARGFEGRACLTPLRDKTRGAVRHRQIDSQPRVTSWSGSDSYWTSQSLWRDLHHTWTSTVCYNKRHYPCYRCYPQVVIMMSMSIQMMTVASRTCLILTHPYCMLAAVRERKQRECACDHWITLLIYKHICRHSFFQQAFHSQQNALTVIHLIPHIHLCFLKRRKYGARCCIIQAAQYVSIHNKLLQQTFGK